MYFTQCCDLHTHTTLDIHVTRFTWSTLKMIWLFYVIVNLKLQLKQDKKKQTNNRFIVDSLDLFLYPSKCYTDLLCPHIKCVFSFFGLSVMQKIHVHVFFSGLSKRIFLRTHRERREPSFWKCWSTSRMWREILKWCRQRFCSYPVKLRTSLSAMRSSSLIN